MAKGIKLRPNQPMRRFVGIDGTLSVDTVVWGHLWNATFGWRNLLWELNRDPTNDQRRIDTAHPELPIRRLKRRHGKAGFADTCILPEGDDGKGLDQLWPGPDLFANDAQMRAAGTVLQTFVLSPGAEAATSTLNDTGQGVTADVVYISSHGGSSGNMVGEQHHLIFDTGQAALAGRQFAGPAWVLLSNCNTLKPQTHGDWVTLMTGPRPLRGVVGFQRLCPLAPGSASLFKTFIELLARGRTLRAAWERAVTDHTDAERWVVLCHDQAKDDRMATWNADTLPSIPTNSQVLMFDKDHRTGTPIAALPDPFETFWSKGGTRITPTNRVLAANTLAVNDNVTITVRPPGGGTFPTSSSVAITLIYIRPDYPRFAVDVTKMFKVTGHPGASGFTPRKLNLQGLGSAPDSWRLNVAGTPTEVVLQLTCIGLTGSKPREWMWLRVDIDGDDHDFIRNGMIVIQ
jgi:hypothetical protein